jgi:hypothetical protein
MRHAAARGLFKPPLAPAALPRGVLQAATGAALVTPAGFALVGATRCSGARPAAVALAAVTAAAQQHLLAATRAQEQAGWGVGQARSSGLAPRAPEPRAASVRWTRSSGDATLTPHPQLLGAGHGAVHAATQ